MIIVFPSSPVEPRQIDDAFKEEADAARRHGFSIAFTSMELMLGGDVVLRGALEPGRAMYRGWLMKPEHYEMLATEMTSRGCPLLMNPENYRTTYMLPEWYERVNRRGPFTMWREGAPKSFNVERVAREVHGVFGEKAVLLKDYLKSQKHYWFDACFMPDASDHENVEKVISTFLRITDENLIGGLVFREFLPFKRIGTHKRSKLPLINEWRAFRLHGETFYLAPYWADGDYEGDRPSLTTLHELTQGVHDLPFITADVGQLETGEWELIEIGDGGASGIPPEGSAPDTFYAALASAVSASEKLAAFL